MLRKSLLYFSVFSISITGFDAMAASPQQSARLEHLSSGNSRVAFSEYANREYSISFKRPTDWPAAKFEDKENVAKFAGVTADGLNGEILLNRFENGGSPETISTFLNQYVFSKLGELRKTQEKKIAIGLNRRIPATMEDITFSIGELKLAQRYVIFQHRSDTFAFIFTSPVGQFSSMTPLINDVLLSVRTDGGITNGGTIKGSSGSKLAVTGKNPVLSAEKSYTFQTFHSATLPISFAYPSEWAVTSGSRSDEVNIEGSNSKGHAAAIVLHKGESDPNIPIEEIADMMEKEFYAPLKSFHRISRQVKNFGRGNKISGVIQEQSLEQDGMLLKQMVAIFHHGEKTYALSLVTPTWKDSELHQLFSKVVASIELKD